MDHYFANPLAVLTEPWGAGAAASPAVSAAIIARLTPVHAQALRLLPSFQRYFSPPRPHHGIQSPKVMGAADTATARSTRRRRRRWCGG
jgi:hypothetical protein